VSIIPFLLFRQGAITGLNIEQPASTLTGGNAINTLVLVEQEELY
jgi:hypothetical protein